jgi:hypothetical protein
MQQTLDRDIFTRFDGTKQARLSLVRERFPDCFGANPPDEQLLELTPFLCDRPQMFYNETVYENVLEYLTDYYGQHPDDLVPHFAYTASSWRRGVLRAEYYSRVIEQTRTEHLERTARIRGYWGPWYLGLAEECLKDLCGPVLWALLKASGKKAMLEDLGYMSTRAEKLNTVPSLSFIVKDFEPTVRNACAHSGITVRRDGLVVFEADKGQRIEWDDREFLSSIEGMLDVCNALVFAVTIFIFRNWEALSNVFHFVALPEEERETLFLIDASTPILDVQSAEVRTIRLGTQVTIRAADTAFLYTELMLDVLAVLRRVHRFYPDVEWVFLGLDGRQHLPSSIRISMAALRDWVSGATTLEQFLQTPENQFLILRFRSFPLAQKVAALRRGIAVGLPYAVDVYKKARRGTGRPWRLLEVGDTSTGPMKRLNVRLIVPEGLTREQVEQMLAEATEYIRRKRYKTKEIAGYKRRYRKVMASRPVGYISFFVFTKEKRPADMWADRRASFFVCRAEWFDEQLRSQGLEPVLNLPTPVGRSDLRADWGPRYIP